MKVDFIISSLRGGGAERVLSLITNSLVKNPKYKISVITLYHGEEAYEIDPEITRKQFKNSRRIPILTISSFLNLFKHYKKKINRPDIIVSFATNTNLLTIIIAKIFSIKIIAQEHISHIRTGEKTSNKIKYTRKFIYPYANVVTVLTSFDIEFYKSYGVNVMVLPNPCTFKSISSNTHDRNKTILAIGGLDRYHHKGFDNLIKLIVPILNANPEWRLKIAGSGKEGYKYLSHLSEMYNISDKIIFTGFVKNISDLMNESSIFILSSRFEGLPMVLLEAMSQGMACIAFNCLTGPSDIIIDNKNGLLIENQNLSEMQKGLTNLIENPELRKRLSNEGIKSLHKYEIREITTRYEELFKNLLNNP